MYYPQWPGATELRGFIDLLADRATNLSKLVLDIGFNAVPKEAITQLARHCVHLKEIHLEGQYMVLKDPSPSYYGSWLDLLENLPATLSGVKLSISLFTLNYPAVWPDGGALPPNPQRGITTLEILGRNEGGYPVPPALFAFLPALEGFEILSGERRFDVTQLKDTHPALKYLGLGEEELRDSDTLPSVQFSFHLPSC